MCLSADERARMSAVILKMIGDLFVYLLYTDQTDVTALTLAIFRQNFSLIWFRDQPPCTFVEQMCSWIESSYTVAQNGLKRKQKRKRT